MIDKAIPQGQHGHLDHSQEEWLRLMPDGWDGTDVLNKLRHENSMLRKLVARAHACKTDEGYCESCYQDEGCCPIEREMQELGIEVDG